MRGSLTTPFFYYLIMVISIITSIVGLIIGILIGHLIDKPKLKEIENNNAQVQLEKEKLESDIHELVLRSENLKLVIKDQGTSYQALIAQSNATQTKIDTLKQNILDLTEQQKTAAEAIFESARQTAQLNYEQEMEKMSANLNQRREDINKAYLSLLQDAKEDFQNQTTSLYNELEVLKQDTLRLKTQLEDERSKVTAAIDVAKRIQEEENEGSFYQLQLSDIDKAEIKKLREILPYLRDKEPLNKVIYKYYYEKPYTDLVGRVIGQGVHSGIYKITNIQNQMCYVGQSTDIAQRWRQHIRRGVGAETPTRNKLYPVMYEIGPENFTFEIIEECTVDKLNEREQFWQEFYHAKDYGYSVR